MLPAADHHAGAGDGQLPALLHPAGQRPGQQHSDRHPGHAHRRWRGIGCRWGNLRDRRVW